jgi:transposase-like protein
MYAVGANAAHGLRRTNADKRRAVTMLLDDDEWGQWSDSAIARQCGVSHTFVATVRAAIMQPLHDSPPPRRPPAPSPAAERFTSKRSKRRRTPM